MVMALRCRGVHVSVSLLPPSLPIQHGGFSQPLVAFFFAPVAGPVLYEPPHLSVATPPPDATTV
jgi:hypothetical protein